MGLLPDLDLASTAHNTHTHGRKEVVGSIVMVVDTTVEYSGTILTNSGFDQNTSTRVTVDEISDIVDDTRDDNEVTLLGSLTELIEFNHRKLVDRNTPVKTVTPSVELLLLLLDDALLNGVLREALQVVSQSDLVAGPDEHLSGVPLVPLQGVTVVTRELMMEVVVSLTHGDECGQDVITRSVAVIEGLFTDPVGQRIDTEGGLVNKEETHNASIEQTTLVVTPSETTNEHGGNVSSSNKPPHVVLVLRNDKLIGKQIADVSTALQSGILLEDHPTHVGEPETTLGIIGILIGVSVSVVGTVTVRPPLDASLGSTRTGEHKDEAQNGVSIVCTVSEQTMITSSNTGGGECEVSNREQESLQSQRYEGDKQETKQRNQRNECSVHPVNLLQEVAESEGLFRNVLLSPRHLAGALRSIGKVFLSSSVDGHPIADRRALRNRLQGLSIQCLNLGCRHGQISFCAEG